LPNFGSVGLGILGVGFGVLEAGGGRIALGIAKPLSARLADNRFPRIRLRAAIATGCSTAARNSPRRSSVFYLHKDGTK
jgi:hypothetical protein